VRQVTHQLLSLGAAAPPQLHLTQAVDLDSAFLDTTCLKANIHYPVDWVLLCDAARTQRVPTLNNLLRIPSFGRKFPVRTHKPEGLHHLAACSFRRLRQRVREFCS